MKLCIKVKPKSKVERLKKLFIGTDTYEARISAAPEKGKANIALIKLIAKKFDVSKSSVKIVQGLKSSDKIVEISE